MTISREQKKYLKATKKITPFSNYVVRNQLLEELMKNIQLNQYLITKLQEIQQIDEEEF